MSHIHSAVDVATHSAVCVAHTFCICMRRHSRGDWPGSLQNGDGSRPLELSIIAEGFVVELLAGSSIHAADAEMITISSGPLKLCSANSSKDLTERFSFSLDEICCSVQCDGLLSDSIVFPFSLHADITQGAVPFHPSQPSLAIEHAVISTIRIALSPTSISKILAILDATGKALSGELGPASNDVQFESPRQQAPEAVHDAGDMVSVDAADFPELRGCITGKYNVTLEGIFVSLSVCKLPGNSRASSRADRIDFSLGTMLCCCEQTFFGISSASVSLDACCADLRWSSPARALRVLDLCDAHRDSACESPDGSPFLAISYTLDYHSLYHAEGQSAHHVNAVFKVSCHNAPYVCSCLTSIPFPERRNVAYSFARN